MKTEKILLPFDGSAHSVNAAKYALNLAKLFGAHVTALYCFDWRGNMSEVPDLLISELKKRRQEEADEILKIAGDILANQGINYTLETTLGLPGDVLVRLAESKAYNLIIMGSHGHSDIAGLFLGSVTHKVLNTIYCPVLIVP